MHGFYSYQHDMTYGHALYKTLEGKTIAVTGVYSSKEQGEENYRWLDRTYVGELTEFISTTNVGHPLHMKKVL